MTAITDGAEYLKYVLEKLKKRIQELSTSIAEGQKEIESMHDYYWENYTEMDQYGYENFDNQQALLQQVNANQDALLLKQRFRRMLDSPFFGRVDFRYEGEDEAETFYIGIGNFAERTGSLPLIYDWRAPVSGLFYDYDKGPASYEAPAGVLSGEVISKWQYKIRSGKMVYAFESDVKIDDEILKAELGSHGETQLKNVIRTIQKEQNTIIRNTHDKIMVIQGVAGSGKTSIALHRIAYLLYHDRNLKSSNVLILSPNGIFSDYISHILPELGEENIREMSFDLFAYRHLTDVAADCEERYDEIERLLVHPEQGEEYHYKQSREFVELLEGFVLELEDSLLNFREVSWRGYSKTEAELIQLFYFKFPDTPLLSRMETVAEYFIDEVETLRGGDLSQEERDAVLERFQVMYRTRDIYKLYREFLEQNHLGTLPDVPLEKRYIQYEDVYPLLYLKYRLLGARQHRDIKHLVVDEMQDYSYLQFLIIKMLFSCRMTILGDRAQIMDGGQQDAFAFLPGIFGRDIRRIRMNKSYRNTVEIAEYANRLAGIRDMEVFCRHGAVVQEKSAQSLGQALEGTADSLMSASYETAAVIFLTEKEAREGAELLREILLKRGFDVEHRFSCLDRNSSSFQKGITVTAYYLAKGLEFDCVVGVFSGKRNEASVKRAQYITATRALHELTMYAYGDKRYEDADACQGQTDDHA